MIDGKKDQGGGERVMLFHNAQLERLTLMPLPLFLATWISILLAASTCVVRCRLSLLHTAGLVVTGVLIWTLFEYAMHRLVFHLRPRSALGRHLIFLAHGNHHQNPGDRLRNIMPLSVSLVLGLAFWLLSRALLGQDGIPIFFGFALGYVVYDGVHYACHQLPMRGPLLSALKRHHLRHHYKDHDSNFAITLIVWDQIFGTRLKTRERP